MFFSDLWWIKFAPQRNKEAALWGEPVRGDEATIGCECVQEHHECQRTVYNRECSFTLAGLFEEQWNFPLITNKHTGHAHLPAKEGFSPVCTLLNITRDRRVPPKSIVEVIRRKHSHRYNVTTMMFGISIKKKSTKKSHNLECQSCEWSFCKQNRHIHIVPYSKSTVETFSDLVIQEFFIKSI